MYDEPLKKKCNKNFDRICNNGGKIFEEFNVK